MSVILYACRGCGYAAPRRWRSTPVKIALCPGCGGLYACVPKRESDRVGVDGEYADVEEGEMVSLSHVQEDVKESPRFLIGKPFDAVDVLFGGETPGMVYNSVTLFSGPPGIGKSTVVLQLLKTLSKRFRCLYFAGEESIKQVAMRSKRLGKFPDKMKVCRETDLDEMLDRVDDYRPKIVVVDSIQTIFCVSPYSGDDLEPGSPGAIKHAMNIIADYAQTKGVCFIVIGHVDKAGDIAGPNSGLHHKVDVIMYFDGKEHGTLRTLRPDGKNRFGPTGPEAIVYMEMRGDGLAVVPRPKTWAELEEEREEKKRVLAEATEQDAKVEEIVGDAQQLHAAKREKPQLALVPTATPPAPAVDERVLATACRVEGCLGEVDRACTSASGAREVGFHQSRVDEARVTRPKATRRPRAAKKALPKKAARKKSKKRA